MAKGLWQRSVHVKGSLKYSVYLEGLYLSMRQQTTKKKSHELCTAVTMILRFDLFPV